MLFLTKQMFYICSVIETKLNKIMETVTTLEQLKPKMQVGDYRQVSKVLGCTRDAAKMRLRRGDKEALTVLQRLLDAREALKNEFQNQEQES